jgi:ribosome-associated toxin RatA of RatAB toxin-antitoxin module
VLTAILKTYFYRKIYFDRLFHLYLVLGFFALAPLTVVAQSEPFVSVAKSGETYQVSVRVGVSAQRAVVWRVLTDYDNLHRFVPGMQSSRIVSARGEPLLLEQKGEAGLLFIKLTTTTVSRILEAPEQEIRFDLVSGNLKRMKGSWVLTGHDHTIIVEYRAELVPGFPVPPVIGPAVMAQNVKAMVEGVIQEIERRRLLNTKE